MILRNFFIFTTVVENVFVAPYSSIPRQIVRTHSHDSSWPTAYHKPLAKALTQNSSYPRNMLTYVAKTLLLALLAIHV